MAPFPEDDRDQCDSGDDAKIQDHVRFKPVFALPLV